ncbi:MAG: hypothetical protein M3Q06_07990, partial [Bacteroidota bacterium]|nr:hypothetical protein [Bacteroidota bacterium]
RNDLTQSAADGQASLPLKKGLSTLKLSLPDFCQQPEATTHFIAALHPQHYLLNETISFTDFTRQQERPPQS